MRFSITNPDEYVKSNLFGFFNLIELVRKYKIPHTIFASSSSVYGNSSETSFKENQRTDEPVSFYAATKKSNEVLAHSYSKLYNLRFTGLRFFTVYGPWEDQIWLHIYLQMDLKNKNPFLMMVIQRFC